MPCTLLKLTRIARLARAGIMYIRTRRALCVAPGGMALKPSVQQHAPKPPELRVMRIPTTANPQR